MNFSGCNRPESKAQRDNIVAQVEDRIITLEAFQQRAEFSPPPRFKSLNGRSGKEGLLEWLILEKLLAREAEAMKLDTIPFMREQMKLVKLNAMLRQLYEQKVRRRITVDSIDIQRALQKMQRRYIIRLAICPGRQEAQDIRKEWLAAVTDDPARLEAAESTLLPKPQEVTWGDLEEPLERLLYQMSPGEISPVVRMSKGYAVFRVDRILYQPLMTPQQVQHKISGITKLLRFRKMDSLAAKYVADYMNQLNVVVKGPVFHTLLDVLVARLSIEGSREIPGKAGLPQTHERDRLDLRLQALWHQPLITFKGGHFTLQDMIIKFRIRGMDYNRRSVAALRRQLLKDFKLIVRDELLGREAQRLGLDRHPEVIKEVNQWRDYYLARLYYRKHNLHLFPAGEAGVQADIELPDHLQQLRRRARIHINRAVLNRIELTRIPMVAIRPGRVMTLTVPPWQY